jgi:broad specificity phosphatase PhoE
MCLAGLLAGLVLSASQLSAGDKPVYSLYVVRHAEKSEVGEDPELSGPGRSRAGALAELLRDANIRAIWSSDYQRTRQTASPLAMKLDIEIRIYDPRDLPAMAEDLVKEGETALVVGHSNTTPDLVQLLGGDPHGAIDDGTEFDRLYVLTMAGESVLSTVLLRYSAK